MSDLAAAGEESAPLSVLYLSMDNIVRGVRIIRDLRGGAPIVLRDKGWCMVCFIWKIFLKSVSDRRMSSEQRATGNGSEFSS